MKLQIIGAAFLVMALSSCKKEFLEIQPETTLTTPVFFKTEADFQQAINGAYAPLPPPMHSRQKVIPCCKAFKIPAKLPVPACGGIG